MNPFMIGRNAPKTWRPEDAPGDPLADSEAVYELAGAGLGLIARECEHGWCAMDVLLHIVFPQGQILRAALSSETAHMLGLSMAGLAMEAVESERDAQEGDTPA